MRYLVGVLMMALALVWAPRMAMADAQSQLDLADARYKNGKYEEAVDILSKLLAVKVDPSTEEGKKRRGVYLRARPVYVACLVGLDRMDEAREVALDQYRDNPFFEPPVGEQPQPVIDLFIEVEAENRELIEELREKVVESKQARAKLQADRAKAQAERLRVLEEMASEEKVTTTRSRWIAAIPFGVGQYQNDSVALGVLFSVSQTLALTSTLVSAGIAIDTLDTGKNCPGSTLNEAGEQVQLDCAALTSRFETAQLANWISLGSFAGLIAAGIVEAQISYVGDTTETTKRALPPRVTPDVVVTDTGFFLGLRGRF